MESHTHAHIRIISIDTQNALSPLIAGIVCTLVPLFTAAYATHTPHTALLVGIATAASASIGGLCIPALWGSRPKLSDFSAALIFFCGGAIQTLPFLISDFGHALYFAYGLIALECVLIAFLRYSMTPRDGWKPVAGIFGTGIILIALGLLLGSA